VVAGRFVVSSLTTSPLYNIWMRPGLCVLLSSALAVKYRKARMGAIAAALLLIGASCYGAVQLAANGTYFSHVRYPEIASLIRTLGPENVAVVHDGESTRWGHIYFPLRYAFDLKVEQYLYAGQTASTVRVKKLPNGQSEMDPSSLESRHLLVLHSCEQSARDVVGQIHDGNKPMDDGPVAMALAASERWKHVGSKVFVAYIKTGVDIFERTE
jgi:hypothetical protein